MRYFAEAAWSPTALLPSQGVRWEAVDDTSAHATITDARLAVKRLFRFNADGLIDSVRAQARGRVVNGTTVTAPWRGDEFVNPPGPQRSPGLRRASGHSSV